MQLTVRITGERKLIQHNGRLANPIDPYSRALKEHTSKRKKTDEDHVTIMQLEARAGCYETEDGMLGVPNVAVWRSIAEAATVFKRGKDIKKAVMHEDAITPLEIDGRSVACDEWLTDPNHIDYRAVRVGMARVMRSRPVIPAGWSSVHTFEVFDDVIDLRDLVPILERAGRLVGIMEMRPTCGTFRVDIE